MCGARGKTIDKKGQNYTTGIMTSLFSYVILVWKDERKADVTSPKKGRNADEYNYEF